jgi:2-oxoisovalerate dehydrogenase E2 component (dihydrolipoyl transacylase)
MDFSLPPVGEGLVEVELVRWLVRPGDAVTRGQPLMEVMSDKATMEVPAPFAGVIQSTQGEAGEKLQVGQHILAYALDGEAVVTSGGRQFPENGMASGGLQAPEVVGGEKPRGTDPPRTPSISNGTHRASAAPSVRHLARKLGVDLLKVRGSGPAGRVLLDDLTGFLTPKGSAPAAKPAAPKVDYGTPGTTQRLAGLRKVIAERMVASKRTIPHYAYVDECDATDLVRLRNQLKEPFAANGVKLTFLPFLITAVVRALKDVPIVNSSYDEASQTISLHDKYNVGFAVSVPNGLIVPVIKNADKLDLAGIANEVERLGEACRTNKIKADDLQGGTFTITSVGNIGGLISTPIINAPEVGIMGVGRIVKRPVYDDSGNLRPADLLYLSFSFDHRIVDGAVGIAFGNAVLKRLQNPGTLMMGEKR